MEKGSWRITEPSGEVRVTSKREQVPYSEPIEVTDKMPKGQLLFAELFNAYRVRLLELGEMKPK